MRSSWSTPATTPTAMSDTATTNSSQPDRRTHAGRRRMVQSGRTTGGRSVVVLVPDSKLAVAVLANVDGEHLDDHALKIAELFAEPE